MVLQSASDRLFLDLFDSKGLAGARELARFVHGVLHRMMARDHHQVWKVFFEMIVRPLAVVGAIATALVATSASATNPTRTFAQFQEISVHNVAPKIVSLKNLDTLKTTSVTTRTPIYGPVYDKKGKVIGQKITGYTSNTVKSTLITPKTEIYSTSGASTAFATPIVNFNYLTPVEAPFRSLIVGTQKAYFSLDAFSTVAPVKSTIGSLNLYTQIFGPGTVSFTRTAPIQLYSGNHKPIGPARSNLLTIAFNSAQLVSAGSSTTFSLLGSTPGQTLTYTSDFLNFGNATAYDFSITMTAANPALTIAPVDPTLTNVTGARTFNTTRANVSGGFAANSVPEPQSWALMIVGFGMVGVSLRRRKVLVA